jgi:beta-lactamase class D
MRNEWQVFSKEIADDKNEKSSHQHEYGNKERCGSVHESWESIVAPLDN